MFEEFIFNLEGNQRVILEYLNSYFMSSPGIQCKIRYKIPFYYRNSWISYTNPIKNDGIELVFLRGNELSNQHGILDAKDRKQVSGIELYSREEIPFRELEETWLEALMLDEEVPYRSPSRRKKNK
ncbi:MAG: DUF1801 domain-containing protein [Bacteroidia bacterium]|nr:DUF1801 domain-containing protein [Bacteroidia bacterium]